MVSVDVVSDVMCPWCYIGKRRLDEARALLPGTEVEVRWRPFQLDPALPAEGRPRREYLEAKFGSLERARAIYDRVVAAGREVGIAFDPDTIKVSANTLDAHRLIRWSASAGRQDQVVERLFELYFLEGANIGDHEVLADAADDAGMDRTVVRDLLTGETDRAEVGVEIEQAMRLGISGVPAFIIASRYLVSGAQAPEVLADALAQAEREAELGAAPQSA